MKTDDSLGDRTLLLERPKGFSVRVTVWPSGLRRQTQVLVEQSAWVRTPQLSVFVFFCNWESYVFSIRMHLRKKPMRLFGLVV